MLPDGSPETWHDPAFEGGHRAGAAFINPLSSKQWASCLAATEDSGAVVNRSGSFPTQLGKHQPQAAPLHLTFQPSATCFPPRLIFVGRAEGQKELVTITCRAAYVVCFIMSSSPLPFQEIPSGRVSSLPPITGNWFSCCFSSIWFALSGTHMCPPPSQPSLPSLLRSPQVRSSSFRVFFNSLAYPWFVHQATARRQQRLSAARNLTGRMDGWRREGWSVRSRSPCQVTHGQPARLRRRRGYGCGEDRASAAPTRS